MPAETRKLPASYVRGGADHWTARSGYKRSPRVPGPIQPMEEAPAWPAIIGAAKGGFGLFVLCVVATLLIVAFHQTPVADAPAAAGTRDHVPGGKELR